VVTLIQKWKDGLAKTSKSTFGQIATLLGATEITDETFEELEALLIKADLGIDTSEAVLERLWERERKEGLTKSSELKGVLRQELAPG
jgi:fused signal recognition particle receptor